MDELHGIRDVYENLSISNQKEDSASDLKLKTSEEISDQVNSKIISFCAPNEVGENSLYCDGPGTRTRSKMGQNSPGYIPSEFLTQVPVRTHKKKENRKCTVCGKSARSPSDLQRHMRVHTGECPFACQMCKKSFKSKRSLLNHQYLSHGVEDGLSQNRLKFLREKQMKKNPPQLQFADQPVKIDEDEDTEIIDGHDELSFTELPVSFSGLFSKSKEEEEEPCPEEVENSKVESNQHIPNGEHSVHNFALNASNEQLTSTPNHVSDEDSLSLPILTKHEPSANNPYEPRNGEILNQNMDPNNFLMMETKTHECNHCKKQFRSVYTLRYHLRSKHGEMVYLSPALESRLKKRRWFPPYVHLQQPEGKLYSTSEQISTNESILDVRQTYTCNEQAVTTTQKQTDTEAVASHIPSSECNGTPENKHASSQSSNTSFSYHEPNPVNEDKTYVHKTSSCLEENVAVEQGSANEVTNNTQHADSEPYMCSTKNGSAEDKRNTQPNNIYYVSIDNNEAEAKTQPIKMPFSQNEQIIAGSNKHFDEHFMHMSLMCLAAEARHNSVPKNGSMSSIGSESEILTELKQKEGAGLDLTQKENASYGIMKASTEANKRPVDVTLDLCHKIKKEKLDEISYEINNNTEKALLNHSTTFKNPLTIEKDTKQDSYFTSNVPNQSKTLPSDTFGVDNSAKQAVVDPFVLPPQIFLPSTSASSEGSENENPISWDSIKVTSENALVTKLEAVHSMTQQKFILYKCCLCGKAFSGLRIIFTHLALHNDGDKEKDCDKCGASFKWSHELDFHRECHRATERKYVPASPFLPSYYVNPFPIPVVASGEQAVMSAAGLLSYPFFPMPQQISPMMQPGFFPFFAATLQTPQQVQTNAEPSPHKSSHSSPNTESTDNFEDKSVTAQSCSFQCKVCPKSFDRIFSLQRHERIHSGVKACFCKTCGRGFSELRNLRHHIVRFHADTAQREPLPYRRKPSRVRNVSSSQRLVSFLKKTAVRILNSMGQHKIDPPASSVKIQTDDTLNDSSNQETKGVPENLSMNRDEPNKENRNEHAESSPVQSTFGETQLLKMNHGDDVTSTKANTFQSDTENSTENQVNLLEHSMENTMSQLSAGNVNHLADSESESANVSETQATHPVEVLQDPKRSLMGNRRKGRPFKLSSTTYHPLNAMFDENLSLTSNTGDNDNSISCLNLSIESSGIVLQPSHESDGQENNPEGSQAKYFDAESEANEPIDMSSTKEIKQEPFVQFDCSKTQSENFHPTSNGLHSNFRFDTPEAATTQSKPVLNNGGTEAKCLFPCSYCYKSFSSLSEINRHMTFHTDIRPFKCPYCSYCSRTNSQLKVHMMRHEGIKHYMCHICNYNGVTQSDLNRHLKTRTHHLRSRNVCSCCGTGFHTRSLSDEHSKTCHMNPNRDKSSTDSANTCPPVNKGRLSRLKCTKNPDEERMKNELYQKIFDLSKMSLTFNNFLQQAAPSNTVK